MKTLKRIGLALSFAMFFVVVLAPKVSILRIPGTYVGIRIDDIMAVLLVMFFAGAFIFSREYRQSILGNRRLMRIAAAFLAYFAITIIATLLGVMRGSVGLSLGGMYCARAAEYFLMMLAGLYIYKESRRKELLFTLILAAVILHAVIALLQYNGVVGAIKDSLYFSKAELTGERVWSTFNGPYEFACFMTMMTPVCLYTLLTGERSWRMRVLALVAFISGVVGIVLSQSRVSFVILMVLTLAVLVWRFVTIKNRVLKKRVALGAAAVLLVGVIAGPTVVKNTTFFERFSVVKISEFAEDTQAAWEARDFDGFAEALNTRDLSDTKIEIKEKEKTAPEDELTPEERRALLVSMGDVSFKVRIQKWMHLIQGWMRQPVFGMGASVAREAVDGNYVRLLVESGLLGLASWIAFIVVIVANFDRSKKRSYAMAIFATATIMISAILIDVFAASKIMMFYYILVGYNVALPALSAKESKKLAAKTTKSGKKLSK